MEFYQKLQKMRKEKGMSQEELAAQLGVSRQAVSKWESGQGYPETQKLLMIGNLFSVSMDYLLKDEPMDDATDQPTENGYYASRETVEGFLIFRRRKSIRIAAGVAVCILAFLFPLLIEADWAAALMFATAMIGVALLVSCGFMPNPYLPITQQPLLFDPSFLAEFKIRYGNIRKTSGWFIIAGIGFCVLALVSQIVFDEAEAFLSNSGVMIMTALFPLLVASGVGCIIFGSSSINAAQIIADNREYLAEEADDKRYGWIWAVTMPLATMAFLALGFTYDIWHPGWLVYPVTAILTYGLVSILKGIRKAK